MKRTQTDYLRYLEELALERPDVEWCEECEEAYPRRETQTRDGRTLCDWHAEYKDLCDREEAEAQEAAEDMREHGSRPQFFSTWRH